MGLRPAYHLLVLQCPQPTRMSWVEIVQLRGIEFTNFQPRRLCAYLHQTFLVNLKSLTKSINWLRQEERNGETQPEIDRKIDIQKPCAAATTTDIEVSCTVHNGVKIFNKSHSNFEKTKSFTRYYQKLKSRQQIQKISQNVYRKLYVSSRQIYIFGPNGGLAARHWPRAQENWL